MAKNSQTPLVSFEDLRPYVKLVGKNWWLLVGLAIVGYAGGRLVTHQMVDVHKATAEMLVNQKASTGVDAMFGAGGGARAFSYYNDEVQNQLRVLRSQGYVQIHFDRVKKNKIAKYVSLDGLNERRTTTFQTLKQIRPAETH